MANWWAGRALRPAGATAIHPRLSRKDPGLSPGRQWAVKSALTWAAVIAVVAVGFAIRYALVQGLLTPIYAVSPGTCRAIAGGLPGVGDFAVDVLHDAILDFCR